LVKAWRKPGEFTKFLKNHKIKNQDAFYTSEIHQKKCFKHFFGEIYPFWRWIWKKKLPRYHLGESLVKTWRIRQVWLKPGEFTWKLVKFQNLVKTWWTRQVFFVKTWWNLKTSWKSDETLVNLPIFFLVKTWWNFKAW
jgi:hypothetical protein